MEAVGVLLTIIVILIAIAWLRHRIKNRFDPFDNFMKCQAEFDDVEHDLTHALSLQGQAERQELTWAEACRQLGHEGRNPALVFMTETPDGDEPAAQDFFETAVKKLRQVHAKATENLEMAQILQDDENEEA